MTDPEVLRDDMRDATQQLCRSINKATGIWIPWLEGFSFVETQQLGMDDALYHATWKLLV